MTAKPDLQQRQPLGHGPGAGEHITVTPDLLWFRIVTPTAPLGGVNIWALREDKGWAIVDTGFADPSSAAQWDGILAQLDGPLTRIICTHFHPDHIGQIGTLLRRFEVPLLMTEVEWDRARAMANPADDYAGVYAAHLFRLGLDEEAIAKMSGAPRQHLTTGLPESCQLLRAGDELELAGGRWTVSVGAGHSPAPAILENSRHGLMIVGDQLLMRITPHVGTEVTNPDQDALGDYLDYLASAEEISASTLALPGHGAAFTFAGLRAQEIAAHHRDRLQALVEFISRPALAVDTINVLFGRPLKGLGLVLGLSEAEAHLQHLVHTNRARKDLDASGRYLYSAR